MNETLFDSRQCRDCAHWLFTRRDQLENYPRDLSEDRWYLDGVCNRIKRSLTITASGGWEGATVDSVESDANFGCILFEPKKP